MWKKKSRNGFRESSYYVVRVFGWQDVGSGATLEEFMNGVLSGNLLVVRGACALSSRYCTNFILDARAMRHA
jgi:hypothetical protein